MVATADGPPDDLLRDLGRPWLRMGLRASMVLGGPGMLAFGLPLHAGLRRLGLTRPATYAIVGILAGSAAGALFVALGGLDFGQVVGVRDYAMATTAGGSPAERAGSRSG